MRKLIGTLTILAVIIVGVGAYRGWFGVAADDRGGKTNVEISVDKDKIKEDAQTAKEKAKELVEQ